MKKMKKNTWTNIQINQYSNETDQMNIDTQTYIKHICGTLKITFLNLQYIWIRNQTDQLGKSVFNLCGSHIVQSAQPP